MSKDRRGPCVPLFFILSAPRSSSFNVFERRSKRFRLSNIGGESHEYRNFPHLRFADADFASASVN